MMTLLPFVQNRLNSLSHKQKGYGCAAIEANEAISARVKAQEESKEIEKRGK
jgi:hypothetical protein